MNIAVYCGWRNEDDTDLLELAKEVGREVARAGHRLVYGGGNDGAMGAVMRGYRDLAHEMTVVTKPDWVDAVDRDPGKRLVLAETIGLRRDGLESASDGFAVLPGGLGTLEELFSIWAQVQNGDHVKPIVIVDPQDYYGGLLEWVAGSGHITPEAQSKVHVARTADGAVRILTGIHNSSVEQRGARAVR